jgi:hypothetical protein
MFSEDKVTEIFCMADDFCKFFDAKMKKYTLPKTTKRAYHREGTLSKAEVMVIIIMFHNSDYRCLKHFYLEQVSKHLRHLFPKIVSYNRFVELEKEVAVPLTIFIKKVLLGKCTGISFVDSTPLRVCKNQRIHMHKVFKGVAQRGKCSMGWFFGFKLHLICNEKGELLNFMITPGDVDDRKPLIETINDELKNIAQVEHSRHRSLNNFMVNMFGGIAAYCFFPKKPCITCERYYDNQLTLF